ncbi:phage tail protein [Aeromonas sp. HMWF016]|uniref:phage tail protein n=1 Tax=Aeromonas sp. HMWF016 TaxID=2056852 RepID=UPI000D3D6587|nr:phage tail protein [Aeromonas sp. HMWF016]PTT44874.1 DNA inversion product [Aeromonas sp. HMWF016]
MSNFGAILTNAGAAKLANAIALGVPLKLTQMAVGDGNGQPVAPDPAMTAIPGEKRRAAINTLFADPLAASQLVAEQIIPEDVGGWWIRCVGLYDDSNTLIAIANVPDTYKPLLTSGAGRTQIIRMVLIVSDTSAVELKIDPSVVLATRKYVDDVMKAHKESRDHPDASETDKGFSRLATQVEVNETTAANRVDAVVTVKTLWGWVKQASETVQGMMKVASQAQTDAGTDDATAITPKKLKAWVKQASESVLGLIKVASQQQTDAGAADDVAVTPKKLKAGFSISLTSQPYVCFPSWMGGWIIQMGDSAPSQSRTTWPIAFPTRCITAAALSKSSATTITYDELQTTGTTFSFQSSTTGANQPSASCKYIAIGN